MTDEPRPLRFDLLAGRWQALLDPLLPLILHHDPGLLGEATMAILETFQRDGQAEFPEWSQALPEARVWRLIWRRQAHTGRRLVTWEDRDALLEANVEWARAVVRVRGARGEDVAEMHRALDILESWIW